jgi:hypothetical protein
MALPQNTQGTTLVGGDFAAGHKLIERRASSASVCSCVAASRNNENASRPEMRSHSVSERAELMVCFPIASLG